MNKKFIGIIASVCVLLIASVLIYKSSRQEVAGTSDTVKPIRGVIIPHHDLASSLIQDSMLKLSQEGSYKTVVVLGPNHYHQNSTSVMTSTEAGSFKINKELVQQMASKFPEIEFNTEIIEKEHSMMIPFFYFSETFDEVSFVPIVYSTKYTDEMITNLSQYLSNSMPEDTLFVAAVDFSHESLLKDGISKNSESVGAISTFNYEKVLSFEDDHLDSPVSIASFMHIMENLGATSWETWHDSHGALLLEDPTLRGTSYVIGVFR